MGVAADGRSDFNEHSSAAIDAKKCLSKPVKSQTRETPKLETNDRVKHEIDTYDTRSVDDAWENHEVPELSRADRTSALCFFDGGGAYELLLEAAAVLRASSFDCLNG